MLGAVIGLTQVFKTESIMKVLETKIPPGFLEMNKKAFTEGVNIGREILASNKPGESG